jgi:hypothetical protein
MGSLELFMLTNNLDHGSPEKGHDMPSREKQYETIREYFKEISQKFPAVIFSQDVFAKKLIAQIKDLLMNTYEEYFVQVSNLFLSIKCNYVNMKRWNEK